MGEGYQLSLAINIQYWQRLCYCMIHLLHSCATKRQLDEMLETLGVYIKLAVDIRRGILAGGGALHADCEAMLLEKGSQQDDIWGADWIPSTQQILYEALINIRPKQNNPSMKILDPSIRNRIAEIVQSLLGGI
jgi:hypothetical protein